MGCLTIPMPLLPCYVRRQFLRNMQDSSDELEKAYAFAVSSRPHRAMEFWVMTEFGGVFQGVPINALCQYLVADEPKAVSTLQWWSCPSYQLTVAQFPFLRHREGSVKLKDGRSYTAEYFCTFDFYVDQAERIDCTHSEEPAEKKALHMMKLGAGDFCLAPNDKILWAKDSWMDGYGTPPNYLRNTYTWCAEKEE